MARDGLSKKDVKQWLFEHARVPMRLVSKGNLERHRRINPKRFSGLGSRDYVRMVDRPEDFIVVVSGGSGRHSAVIHTFGTTRSITVPVTDKDGEPVLAQGTD
jgi:hypothetical protein